MEKKEMSFIDKFAAAGEELKKEIKDGYAMIMIASSEGNNGSSVSASIKGKSRDLSTLLAYVASKDKDIKTMFTNALMRVEALEQIIK